MRRITLPIKKKKYFVAGFNKKTIKQKTTKVSSGFEIDYTQEFNKFSKENLITIYLLHAISASHLPNINKVVISNQRGLVEYNIEYGSINYICQSQELYLFYGKYIDLITK